MKKALAYVVALLCFFVPIGCSNQSEIENDSNAKQEQTIAEETEEIEESKTVNEEILYDKNESINLYLNKYNKLHPEAPITTDMFSTYHHHGTDHDDQILMYVDKAEIIISGGSYTKDKSVSIYIGYRKNVETTNEEYKQLFIDYALPLNESLNVEKLDQYWEETNEEITKNKKFDELDLSIYSVMDKVEYFKFGGKLQ